MNIKKNFLGHEVIIVDKEKEVLKKPYDFLDKKNDYCPFCHIENENHNIIFKDKKEWNVVVVKNKYPFVNESYVIVHKDHNSGFESAEYVKELEKASKFMYKKAVEKGRYALIFKNKGEFAGASLEHSHEQAILLKKEDKPRFDENELLEYIKRELRGPRAINEFSFAPEASIRSYEVWVLLDGNLLQDSKKWERISLIFNALKRVLNKNFDYNAIIYHSENGIFPPFVQIFPRHSPIAGLEIALNRYVNPILPEKVAFRIRKELEGKR